MFEIISSIKPGIKVQILFPEGLSKLSKNIARELKLDIHENETFEPETIIVVDTGKLYQLGVWKEKLKTKKFIIIVIDHHIFDSEIDQISDYYLIRPQANSTCEIVYEIFTQIGLKPSKKTAKALLSGIAYDSKFFSLGGYKMFEKVAKLLKIAGEISDIKELMNLSPSFSEKIARLKGAQRLEIYRIDKWVLVTSQISSHQASGARGLISLGADFVMVSGIKKDKLRSSLRSTKKFFDETGVNLGKVTSELAELLNGSGSGHPTAAGFNGRGTVKELEEKTFKIIKDKIG